MDWVAYGNEIVQNMVASVPQFVFIVSTIVYSLKKVKANTREFPNKVTNLGNELKDSFNEQRKILYKAFEDVATDVKKITKDIKEEISLEINGSLVSMKESLTGYLNELNSTREQMNLLVRENKVFMEVIGTLISKDPQKVRDGVATIISTKLNMTKEDLENFPGQLMNNLPLLESSLKEALVLLGEKKFEELMVKIGYVRKES